MARYGRFLIAVTVVLAGLALVPFSGLPAERFTWENFASAYEPPPAPQAWIYLIGVSPFTKGPDVARAANGDTIEIVGTGSFTESTTLATGAGTFIQRTDGSKVRSRGTWVATGLVQFRSYGSNDSGPAELQGGRAMLRIHMMPFGDSTGFDAILVVTSRIGKGSGGPAEGVEVRIINGLRYNKPVRGTTAFVKINPANPTPLAPDAVELTDE